MSILMNAQHLRKMKQRAENARSKKSATRQEKTKLEKEKQQSLQAASKMEKHWTFHMDEVVFSVLFHKTSLAVSCNGIAIPAAHEFCKDGAVVTFSLNDHLAQVKTSTHPKDGIVFSLTIDGQYVPSTDDY